LRECALYKRGDVYFSNYVFKYKKYEIQIIIDYQGNDVFKSKLRANICITSCGFDRLTNEKISSSDHIYF
jgi:hypothetical protein